MYGWEGGTEKPARGGAHLKNALDEVPAVGASSTPKRARAIRTTGLTVAGADSEPALDPLPDCWEQVSEAWEEATSSPCPGRSSQNWLQEALVDRASSSHPGGVGWVAFTLPG